MRLPIINVAVPFCPHDWKFFIMGPLLWYEPSSVWNRAPCWGITGTSWWTNWLLDLPASQHSSQVAPVSFPSPYHLICVLSLISDEVVVVDHMGYYTCFFPGARTKACNKWNYISYFFRFSRFHKIPSGLRRLIRTFLYPWHKLEKTFTRFLSSWIWSLKTISLWCWSSTWVM